MVGVAQLVERRVVVADVAGSSPVTHPTFYRAFRGLNQPMPPRGAFLGVDQYLSEDGSELKTSTLTN